MCVCVCASVNASGLHGRAAQNVCARICELREHVCLFVEWDSEFVSRVEV